MSLKTAVKKFKQSENTLLQLSYFLVRKVYVGCLYIFSSDFRNQFFGKRKYKNTYFQEATYTELNRYPLLFKLCKEYFTIYADQIQPHRILSFGCSTGEEVITLRQFFPNSVITGADINDWCLVKCIKKDTKKQFIFLNSQSEAFKKTTGYNAIFCLAVLQHTDNRSTKGIQQATSFTFEQFDRILVELDSKLVVNGLLVIDHTDFSFSDSYIADRYEPYNVQGNFITRKVRNQFDSLNNKIGDTYKGYRIFIKKSF